MTPWERPCYVCGISLDKEKIRRVTVGKHRVHWLCDNCFGKYIDGRYDAEVRILERLKAKERT